MAISADLTGLAEITQFLALRMIQRDPSWVGLSSDAMVAQAITGGEHPRYWPADQGDLARCEETYRRAPTSLQERMLPTLKRFRRHLAQGGSIYCYGCDTSGHSSAQRNLCESCWAERRPAELYFGRVPRKRGESPRTEAKENPDG